MTNLVDTVVDPRLKVSIRVRTRHPSGRSKCEVLHCALNKRLPIPYPMNCNDNHSIEMSVRIKESITRSIGSPVSWVAFAA